MYQISYSRSDLISTDFIKSVSKIMLKSADYEDIWKEPFDVS